VTLPDAAGGELRLNGVAVNVDDEIPVGDLDTLVFVPVADWNGVVSFDWQGFDGTAYAATQATVTLTITPVYDPPTVGDLLGTANEDGSIPFNAQGFIDQFQDIEGRNLMDIKVISLPDPASGAVMLNGVPIAVNAEILVADLDQLSFVPESDWNGTTTFDWLGGDGVMFSLNPGTVTITINPVNDAPTVGDVTGTALEDGSIAFTGQEFFDQFTDVDGNTLAQIKIVTLPDSAGGELRLNGVAVTVNDEIPLADLDTLVFVPVADWNGTVSFDWLGSDGTVYALTQATVNLTITPVNDAPSANDLTTSTPMNTSVSGSLTGTDPEGTVLSYSILDQPTHGGVSPSATGPGAFFYNYTPQSGYVGGDSFTYRSYDGSNYSAPATISVTVTPVNSAPVVTIPLLQVNLPTNVFNASTDLTNNFTQGTSATGSVAWSSSAGLSGGGGVAIASSTDQIWTLNSGVARAVDGVYTLSAYMLNVSNSGFGSIGFTAASPSSSTGSYGAPGGSQVGIFFHGGGGGFLNDGPVNGSVHSMSWTSGDLVANSWYKFVLTVTDLGSNQFRMNFKIYNSDSSGTVGSLFTDTSTDSTYSSYVATNSALGAGNTLYPYFSYEGTRFEAVDNFEVSSTVSTTPSVNYTENGAAVTLNNTLTLSDADDVSLTGAQIAISSGFTAGDTLNFSNQNGISGVYASGVLTLSGPASLIDYQTALRSVTFSSTSETLTTATRTISWQVTDADSVGDTIKTSTAVTTQLDVTGVNDAPTGANQSVSMAINTDYTFNANQFGFSDVDNATLASVRIVNPGTHLSFFDGNFWIANPTNFVISYADLQAGHLHYNGNASGTDTFTFKVSDGTTESVSTYSMSATVTNDVPDNTGTPFQVAVNGSVNDVIDALGDQDWFYVQLTAGSTYQFNLNGSTGGYGTLGDPYLRFLDGNGGQLDENDDYNGLNSQINYSIVTTGTYFLEANALSNAGTGTYFLQVTCTSGDPLVLDLDGNGIGLTAAGDGARFDMNQDGATEATGWISRGDGLLVLDGNQDGRIEGIGELVSDQAVPGSGSSLNALATMDLNHDGRVDADDEAYARLQVWRDLNHDGVSDTGELFGLSQLGIAALNLTPTGPAGLETQQGNAITARTTFEWRDGSQGSMAEVGFRFVPNESPVHLGAVDPWQLAQQGVKMLLDDGAPLPATPTTSDMSAANTIQVTTPYHDMVLGDAAHQEGAPLDTAILAGVTGTEIDPSSFLTTDSNHPHV
ncbi:MAG: tandem-95 repeat protein, partial [Magnetococcales bacterium]|nr:tandem-95 repeat protein [Magnetococcales bacterium]